jgi:peptidoglycan/LPS O-acetylase OafA/YrhL
MPGLDALRGVAILLVLFHNLSISERNTSRISKVWNLLPEGGWIGVQIFFVLSGFLITGILADDRGGPRAFRNFYWRRALRIFPLYYALFCFLAVLHATGVLRFPIPASRIGFYLFYMQNWSGLLQGEISGFSHLWSLAVEEQFYLLWPLLIGVASLRGSVIACVVIIAASFVSRVAMRLADLPPLWLYLSTPARADALAFGALLALLLRSDSWKPRLVAALPWVGGASALALAAIVMRTHGLNRQNLLMQLYGYTLIAILAGVATARAALAETSGLPGLGARILTFFGKYSYGIYVVHVPVKVAVLAALGGGSRWQSGHNPIVVDLIFTAATTVISVGLALVSWRLIERPFLLLKDRLAPR